MPCILFLTGPAVAESFKKPDKILRVISEVNEAISVSNGHRNVLTTVLDTLSEAFKVECCWVQRVNPASQKLVLASQRGFTPAMKWELNTSGAGQYFNNLVSRYGHKVVVHHLSRQHDIDLKSFRMARLRSLVAVPITTYRIGGILGMASRKKKRFGQDTAELLAVVAGMIGTALEKAELYERASSNGHNGNGAEQKDLKNSVPLPHPQSRGNPEVTRFPVKNDGTPRDGAARNLKARLK
jgi:GAF domain-containing protein